MIDPDNKNQPQSDSESEEESNPNQNTTQIKKDKKKKKKNKAKNANTVETKSKNQPQSAMGKLIAERQRLIAEEDARIKALEEEEERKRKEEEERAQEIKKKEEEEKEKKKKAKQDKINAQKIAGTYKTKAEKEREKKNQEKLSQLKKFGMLTQDGKTVMNQDLFFPKNVKQSVSDTESESDSDQESEELIEYKCPIFTIFGHTDVGKTSLLDNLRQTTVQKHEVGGITQQLGATLLARETIIKRTCLINPTNEKTYKIPGLLLVDTPGHEVFSNLRQKGVKLADIAIVIIDIVHGLEPQTKESIKLLVDSKTPFIFALNKIDRLYGFKDINSLPIDQIIRCQDENVQGEFNTRFDKIRTQIMELGINCELAWDNNSPEDTISIVPISAVTGHGIPDLIDYIIRYSQNILQDQIIWKPDLDCMIMEQTNTDGYGFTIDCIIKNGQISRGDIIRVQTSGGTILTQIKSLLTIPSNRDSKYTTQLISNDSVKGANGVKIYAHGFEKALPGTSITLGTREEFEKFTQGNSQLDMNMSEEPQTNSIQLNSKGIGIFTSTYGSLEALNQLIRSDKDLPIPTQISYTSVGTVMKKDLEKILLMNVVTDGLKENMCVLAFEVKVDPQALTYAKDNSIIIFQDQTIYRLFNQYKEYFIKVYGERKLEAKTKTVFPCILKIIELNIFNKKNPLVMGVEVLEGNLHLNTPLIILQDKTYIGKVVGIQVNKKDVDIGKQVQSVCVKIDNESNPNITYGRQFTHKDLLYSNLTRQSVDMLKEYFKKDLSKEDIGLLVKLKNKIGF